MRGNSTRAGSESVVRMVHGRLDGGRDPIALLHVFGHKLMS